MKYKVLFSKKCTSRQYENITFSCEVESDDEDLPVEYFKDLVVEKVNRWIDAELVAMGLPPVSKATLKEIQIC